MKKKVKSGMTLVLLLSLLFGLIINTPDALNSIGTPVITACESPDEKKVDISWTKVSGDGYQIQIARDEKFENLTGTLTITQKSKTRISGLVASRAYYLRMRTIVKENGKTTYGKWSNVGTVTIHKHSHVLTSTIDPTCISEGLSKYKCSCGSTTSKTLQSLNHNYIETNKTDTKCGEPSQIEYSCTNCKDKKYQTIDNSNTHNYEITTKTNATCNTSGEVKYTCKDCKHSYSETSDKLSHDYKITETDTQKIYTCKNCNNQYTENKPSNNQSTTIDKEYIIDLGNGQTKTVVGHFDTEQASKILTLLNEYRKENGVKVVGTGSEKLQEAANIRATEIVTTFSHTRPNGVRALTSFNPTTKCCAENLGRYQTSPEQVMNAWKNSTGHNKNLLKADANYVSISVFAEKQSNGRYYYHYVQLFGW